MGSFEKMKERILKKPTLNNIMPKELQTFLEHYGFILKHVNGSHFVYGYPAASKVFMLNIPMHAPVKPAYIDKVRETILEIEES